MNERESPTVGDTLEPIVIALAGQPNVGKSTVLNMLTGLRQHVGNWPGKTIEKKTGIYHHDGTSIQIVDLPGIYSLTANSLEERIARDFIIKEKPDVVVVIVDASTLERNLYLVSELLSLPAPVVLGLNMMDVAEQQGMHIEPHVLEAALGLPVVPMVASKNQGVHELISAVDQMVRNPAPYAPNRPVLQKDHQDLIDSIRALIANEVQSPYPEEWATIKLLEGDHEITTMMRDCLSPEVWEQLYEILMRHEDAGLAIVSSRYQWIGRMVRAAVTRPGVGQVTLTDRLDRVIAHPFWGMLILSGMLGLVFWLTFTVGEPLQQFLDTYLVQAGAQWVRSSLSGAPEWLSGLLADGIIGGAGMVLTFLPILAIFFTALSFLEDIGYMARAAFILDRFMHLMGLHGKSFLPLFLGFGCNVPAVMGARIIDSPRARLLTILVAPLVPCAGRMAVLTVLAPIFFGEYATFASWALVGLSLAILALVGVFLHKVVLRSERGAFIMELPLYHMPNFRTIGLSVWQNLVAFLEKAGTIIVLVSVVIWALSTFPNGNIETSYLAQLGRLLVPVGRLMGLEWRTMVALLTSFIAKENTIATLGILYGAGEIHGNLTEIMRTVLTPISALSFLAVQMLFIPCIATVAIIRQETASWRWTAFSVGLLLVISFTTGIAIYQIGSLIEWGI